MQIREHGNPKRLHWQFIFDGTQGRARIVCRSFTMHPNGDVQLNGVALIDDDILEADKKGGCLETGVKGALVRIEDYIARQSWGRMQANGIKVAAAAAPSAYFSKADMQ